MYCPNCNRYYRKKYGTIFKCACGYNFVFGQKDVIKDSFMLMLEKKASKNETRYFTIDKLYNVYQKEQKNRSSSSKPFFFVKKTQIVSKEHFAQIHYHWQQKSSLKSNKFIEQPSLRQPENPIGEEVFLYGIERIIVVDEPLKVDLLVKNNTHINKKALITSSEGYPDYLKPHLQTILEKQPQVPIGFLHKPELSIDEQLKQFEQNYQVKLQPGQIWDISTNKKYPRKVNLWKIDTSKDKEKSQDNSQTISSSIDETPSKEGTSWLSWILPTSIATGLGIAAAASTNPETETEQNDLNAENETEQDGMSGVSDDSSFEGNDSGFDGFDAGDDGGFGGVDDSDDGDGSDDGGDSDGGDGDGGDGDGE